MRLVFWVFVVLYVAAFVLYLIGTFGWFGQEPDPLSGVFLIPLGWPWNLIGGQILGGGTDVAGPAVGLLSPAINVGILFWLWKR